MTNFLIIGDLHGNMPKIYSNDFDAIIAPGDFCSDAIRKYIFAAMKINLETDIDLNWYDLMSKSKAKKMVRKSLRDGRKILKFLNSLNKPVFALPGNWDWTGDPEWDFLDKNYWKSYLIKGLKNIRDCHKKIYSFQNLTIIGHGITSGPEHIPPSYKTSLTKKEINEKNKSYKENYFSPLNKQFIKAKKRNQPIIFLSHNVPYNTRIDKVKNKESPRNGDHCGSYLARDLIIRHSPLVCIGGHMHENFGKTKLKNTVCINAGFGSYVNTILEIKNNKIKNLKFIKNGRRLK